MPEPPPPARSQHAAPAEAHGKHHEREESVEAYMARLLERVGTTGGAGRSDRRQATPSPTETAEAKRPVPKPAPTPPAASLEPRAPRAVAPEKNVDLSAMRALANLSAQSAIDRHVRGRRADSMRTKFALAALGGGVGAGALAWQHAEAYPTAHYAAIAGFLVAAAFGVEWLVLAARQAFCRSTKMGSANQSNAADVAADEEEMKDEG